MPQLALPSARVHYTAHGAAACLSSARMVTLPCGRAPFTEMPQLFLAHVQPFVAACGQA
jgi:hypothetical protein